MLKLRKDGRYYLCGIATLLLRAFVREPEPGEVTRHLNDDLTDETLDNLAWGTRSDNAHDAIKNGKRPASYYGFAGKKHTEETKELMRQKRKQQAPQVFTEEVRQNMSKAHTGMKHAPEVIERMRLAQKLRRQRECELRNQGSPTTK